MAEPGARHPLSWLSHHYCGALPLGVGSVSDRAGAGARPGRSWGCLGKEQCLPGVRGASPKGIALGARAVPSLAFGFGFWREQRQRTCSYCSEPCLSRSAERESPRPASGRRSNSELGTGGSWGFPGGRSMLKLTLIAGWSELWCLTMGSWDAFVSFPLN